MKAAVEAERGSRSSPSTSVFVLAIPWCAGSWLHCHREKPSPRSHPGLNL